MEIIDRPQKCFLKCELYIFLLVFCNLHLIAADTIECHFLQTQEIELSPGDTGQIISPNYPSEHLAYRSHCTLELITNEWSDLEFSFTDFNITNCQHRFVQPRIDKSAAFCDSYDICSYLIIGKASSGPEIPGPNNSNTMLSGDLTGTTYLSNLKTTAFQFCFSSNNDNNRRRKWSIGYKVKSRMIPVSVSLGEAGSKTITSENFPNPYPRSSQRKRFWKIDFVGETLTPGRGFYVIVVRFSDADLHEGDNIRIYHNSQIPKENPKYVFSSPNYISGISGSKTYYSYELLEPHIVLEFAVKDERESYHTPHFEDYTFYGWKVKITFLGVQYSTSRKIEVPTTIRSRSLCGDNYAVAVKGGGTLSIKNKNPAHGISKLECIWVIRPSPIKAYLHLSTTFPPMRLETLLAIKRRKLDIRNGLTSESPVAALSHGANKYDSRIGFYVRLYIEFELMVYTKDETVFSLTYVSYTQTSNPLNCRIQIDGTHGKLCRRSEMCIHRDFFCDGANHCPRGDDESDTDCQECRNLGYRSHGCPEDGICVANGLRCPGGVTCGGSRKAKYCDDEKTECYTVAERCDNKRDCYNGKDEKDCTCKALNKKSCYVNDYYDVDCYFSHQKCDGSKDCANGMDESNCGSAEELFDGGTSVLWIIVGAVILVFIVCFLICCHCCKQRQTTNNRNRGIVATAGPHAIDLDSSVRLTTFSGNAGIGPLTEESTPPVPEPPPTYTEVVATDRYRIPGQSRPVNRDSMLPSYEDVSHIPSGSMGNIHSIRSPPIGGNVNLLRGPNRARSEEHLSTANHQGQSAMRLNQQNSRQSNAYVTTETDTSPRQQEPSNRRENIGENPHETTPLRSDVDHV
ncbi:unnamed protein product [Owenia fusiformis]|uniref:Uncharacterized protein n=1 Tax=Owenia fusiformis TaxID=6347 RepID=A0A8J1TUX5_OWEFU|nr:unnamed protein product [Owenia fusiformis]